MPVPFATVTLLRQFDYSFSSSAAYVDARRAPSAGVPLSSCSIASAELPTVIEAVDR
jgi:hypothetical protein